jgi:hypothetical protein
VDEPLEGGNDGCYAHQPGDNDNDYDNDNDPVGIPLQVISCRGRVRLMAHHQDVDYSDEVRQGDTEQAQSTVKFELFPDERNPWAVDLKGTCPRCLHEQPETRRWVVTVSGASKSNEAQRRRIQSELAEIGIDLSSGDETFDLQCACSEEHAHRPSGKAGCGSKYRVRVVWSP